jgi:hypothetical protein
MPVSAKVANRIAAQMKRYQGVLATIQKKDISEADTVTWPAPGLDDTRLS